MIELSYISTATSAMSTQDLLALLQQSRKNNADNGVTGMLLYGNGTFLQVLEGDERAVDALIANIRKDPRHTNIKMLYRKTIEQTPIFRLEHGV